MGVMMGDVWSSGEVTSTWQKHCGVSIHKQCGSSVLDA